jgi:esterase/lipase superfamily enzyme
VGEYGSVIFIAGNTEPQQIAPLPAGTVLFTAAATAYSPGDMLVNSVSLLFAINYAQVAAWVHAADEGEIDHRATRWRANADRAGTGVPGDQPGATMAAMFIEGF